MAKVLSFIFEERASCHTVWNVPILSNFCWMGNGMGLCSKSRDSTWSR